MDYHALGYGRPDQQETIRMASHTLLFVYGTLRRGFKNYQRYLGVAEANATAKYIGRGFTRECYPLVLRPPHISPCTRGPILMDRAGTGHQIEGELFWVDPRVLEAMDILEGVYTGAYYREVIEIVGERGEVTAGTAVQRAMVYFFPATDELLDQELLSSYENAHHNLYNPGPINSAIVELCVPIGGVPVRSTQAPTRMQALCVRLQPGDDLCRSLCAFVRHHEVRAAAVLSCVGSTGVTRLRPAAQSEPVAFEGPHEIVSLTGTISLGGHHLHLAISDETCAVRGGHLVEGTTVRTTAEVVLGVLEECVFSRLLDARTGYCELLIGAWPPPVICDGGAASGKALPPLPPN